MSKRRVYVASDSDSDSDSDLTITSSDTMDSDSCSEDSSTIGEVVRFSNTTHNTMHINNTPDDSSSICRSSDSTCIGENGIDVTRNSVSYKDIANIECRPRQTEHKWTLGFNEYSMITRYINDVNSCVNFKRVCTRTNCMFNLPSNLGINVHDPTNWCKLQTHIIHTDIDIGITDFIEGAIHRLAGNHLSFYKYFSRDMLLYKGEFSTYYTILCINGFFPTDIIKLVRSYIKYKGKDLKRYMRSRVDTCSEDTERLLGKYTPDTSVKYVDDKKIRCCLKKARLNSSTALIECTLYNMMQAIFSDTAFMEQTAVVREVPNFRYERYIQLNNVDIPVYKRDDSYTTTVALNSIFRCAQPVWSAAVKTCIEDLTLCNYNFEYIGQNDNSIGDLLKAPANAVVVVQIESFIDKSDNHAAIGKSTTEIPRGTYTVVFLPTLLYNYVQVRHYGIVDPVANDCYYIKDTSTICSFNTASVDMRGIVSLNRLIKLATCIEGVTSRWIKRFVVGVDLYTVPDPEAAIDKGFCTRYINYQPNCLLSMKYGYKVPTRSSSTDTTYMADIYKLERQPITDLVIQAPLSKIIMPFGFKCVVKAKIINDVFSIKEHVVVDSDMYIYSHGHFVPFRQYVAHRMASPASGKYALGALAKSCYIVDYILSSNSSDSSDPFN